MAKLYSLQTRPDRVWVVRVDPTSVAAIVDYGDGKISINGNTLEVTDVNQQVQVAVEGDWIMRDEAGEFSVTDATTLLQNYYILGIPKDI